MLQRTRWMGTLACATLLAGAAATAEARGSVAVGVRVGGHGPSYAVRGGGYHGGYHGGARYGGGYGYRGGWGPSWGLFLGAPLLYPWVVGPTVEVVPQTVVVTEPAPLPLAAMPSRAEPVIYPRNGQSAQQTEADRQECNRWATTLPSALADASVFHRAVEACMDGRGYTLK